MSFLNLFLTNSIASSVGRILAVAPIDVLILCHTEALLSINGVAPPVDAVCLGLGPAYTLLVANRVEVDVKYAELLLT